MEAIINRLPVGIAIVDRYGSLISMNRALLSVIQGGRRLRLEAGRLVSVPSGPLEQAIERILSGDESEVSVRLDGDGGSGPLSLRVGRQRGTKYAIVMAASRAMNALSASSLCTFFGLTPAEARFAQNIALGLTVEEASDALRVKLSTGRTHMRSIMSKVGVRRQPDLLRAIYSSPLWLDTGGNVKGLGDADTELRSDDTTDGDQRLQLADGRCLAYSDSGDPEGLPVILMHCIGGSRRMRHPDDRILKSQGIRLLIPDRPGSGDSEPRSNRRIVDWCDDIAHLTHYLGIREFSVLGFCGGTPYALAVASAFPQRVSALFIVGGLPPLQQPLDARNFSNAFGAGLLVAKYTPSLLSSLARMVNTGIRKNAYRCVERILSGEPEADKQAFANPKLRASFAASLLSATQWGEEGLIAEILLFARDWGVALGNIRAKTMLWHGAMDASVNISAMEQLSRALPGASLTLVPDAGHYILFSHWAQIWRGVRGAIRS
jgi:pimeloyl-ACP methyl ester carboxylesterase/DNA-binding CsgD family transcriptional regulator